MTWIIAHRGASAELPENSLAAFRRAIELGADCLEVDVHLSKEGVPICRHNCAIGPNCSLLSELTVKEIQALTAGPYEVPTLEQLLGLNRNHVGLFIELKSEGCQNPRQLVGTVVDLIAYYQGFGTPTPHIGSFSTTMVRELEACKWPKELTVGIAEYATELRAHLALQCGVVAVEQQLATPDLIRQLHSMQQRHWVWTVDDPAVAAHLRSQGVHGIITNHPRPDYWSGSDALSNR